MSEGGEFGEAGRAWKYVYWGVTDRLFQQGLIENPRMTGTSILITPAGLERARAAAARLFKPETS